MRMKRLFSFPTPVGLPFITERVQVLFTPSGSDTTSYSFLFLSAPPHTQQGLRNDHKASLLQGQQQLQRLSTQIRQSAQSTNGC